MDIQNDQENVLDNRIDELFDHIRKQNEIIDELKNQMKIQMEHSENMDAQNKNQNKINEDLIKKTDLLQTHIGLKTVLEKSHTTEDEKLLSSYQMNTDITKDVIVFDIPAFFCCILRFSYALVAASFTLYYFIVQDVDDTVNLFSYIIGFIMTLSIIFEIFTERLDGKINKVTFLLYAIGGIIYWISWPVVYDEGSDEDDQYSGFTMSLFTGGIITFMSEMIILYQMKRKEMPNMLILSHSCNGFFFIFLLFFTFFNNITICVIFLVFLLVSPIFLLFGLPLHHLTRTSNSTLNAATQNADDQMNLEGRSPNGIHVSIIGNDNNNNNNNNNKNEQKSDLDTNNNNHTSLTDIVHQHHQQLESLEAQIQKPINHFTYNNLRPKGLNENWTTRAKLSPDVYTMMMLSNWTQKSFRHPCHCCMKNSTNIIIPRPSKSWILGLTVFTVQTLLGLVTLFDQQSTEFGDTLMNIPVRGTTKSYTVQFFTLILAVMTQTDILVSFRIVLLLSYGKDTWLELISHDRNERDFSTWLGHILLPNVLKSFQAFIVLVTTFFVILQSESVVELLKDFTALFVISSIDDMFFFLADHGYLGSDLSKRTNKSKKISIEEDDRKIQSILKLFFFTILLIMFGGWIAVVMLQKNNFFINQKYPNCPNDVDFSCIDNGVCDFSRGIGPNILECGWEGGDCTTINERYPDCDFETSSLFADGKCDRISNLEECGYDGGDCLEFNEKYPNCTVVYPSLVGDGRCNDECNTEECGWDGGDCIVLNMVHLKNYPNCKGVNPLRVGDKICDSGTYNTAECGYDGGDCLDFNYKYPSCIVRYPQFVGNTVCNGDEYNTTECGWDGGDCLI